MLSIRRGEAAAYQVGPGARQSDSGRESIESALPAYYTVRAIDALAGFSHLDHRRKAGTVFPIVLEYVCRRHQFDRLVLKARRNALHRKDENIVGILTWIALGLVAGFLAGWFMKGSGYGIVGDAILGIVGAMVGGWLSTSLLGIDVTGFNLVSVIIAFVGACIVIAIYRAFTGHRTMV